MPFDLDDEELKATRKLNGADKITIEEFEKIRAEFINKEIQRKINELNRKED